MPDYSVFFNDYHPFDRDDAAYQFDLLEHIREEERDD